MDLIKAENKDTELDLERGLPVNEDNSKKESSPDAAKQEKSLFALVSGGFIGKIEEKPSLYCNESSLSSVSVDVTNKLLCGQDSIDMEITQVKEKRKKGNSKKASKPPRSPQVPSLDAADQKLIREITQLAMLKRARIERLKALKKMKASKPSSSSSSILATVFTIVFCIVLIFQGMSSGRSSVAIFQGSPLSTTGADGGLISAQFPLTPSANNPKAPSLDSRNNFVKQVTGTDWTEQLRRRLG